MVQVLFRYALAVLSYMEEKLMKQTDYMSIFNTFRTEVPTADALIINTYCFTRNLSDMKMLYRCS